MWSGDRKADQVAWPLDIKFNTLFLLNLLHNQALYAKGLKYMPCHSGSKEHHKLHEVLCNDFLTFARSVVL